jgi:trehalose utilization protein
VFYFRPGHETYPTYHNPDVLKVIANAVRWAAFAGNDSVAPFYGKMIGEPLEKIGPKNYEAAPIDHPSLRKKKK